jgi:hypothetical protein
VYERTNFSSSVTSAGLASTPTATAPEPAPAAAVATAPQSAAVPTRAGPVGPVAYRPYTYAQLETQGDSLVVTAPKAAATTVSAPAPSPAARVAAPSNRVTTEPNREPARVMKIRMGAWEDENGSLHGRSDVFTEIEPRRWTVGTRAVPTSAGFALLEGFGQGAAQDAQPAAGAAAAGSRPGE